jgi:hypothetical protein
MLRKFVLDNFPADTASENMEAGGSTYIRAKEADYPFEISFDDGDWIPFDIGMDVRAEYGSPVKFDRFKIRHFGPSAGRFDFVVGKQVIVGDGRLTISESRNGAAASYTPPNVAEVTHTAGTLDTWIELLPYEAGREEVWIWTNAVTSAFYSLTGDTASESPSRNLVPVSGEGRWTKIRTKAPVHIMHKEAAKTVTALSFSY